MTETTGESVRRLLQEVDGQLGLAVYRNEGSEQQWKDEAKALMFRCREAAKTMNIDGDGS